MTLTLLLDLDGTLLENEIEVFLPEYLKIFSQFVAPQMDPQTFVNALLIGTRNMTRNQRLDCTLKEVFEETFFSMVEITPRKFEDLAENFYTQKFPSLKKLTRPRPGARDLVEQAFARGFQISVATNPLFPLTAIQQRLEWANLPADQFPFQQITSYENYHFAKPDPAFYAEILANLRWPEGGVVMVGDDFDRDISSARKLGLPTFWLEKDGNQPSNENEHPTKSGSIVDILPWLEQRSAEDLQADFSSPSALLSILRSTPAVLDSICKQIDAELWHEAPDESSWDLTEVLCHLRDVDVEVNMSRLKKVLEESNPFLPSEDTDTWAEARAYSHQDGPQALHQFTMIRSKLVELLLTMDAEAWGRKARHAIFGPTDLHELIVIMSGHDRLHVRQVHEILDSIRQ